jgi:enolase
VPAGGYRLRTEGRDLTGDELVELVEGWCRTFPIVSVEDPLADEDWAGWRRASERLGARVQLLGDDLLVTDPRRLARAIEAGVANAVLVKPNQVGTVSQAAQVVADAQAAGYATVVSARSGDTEESWLADLAVGWRAGQIKVGSTMRSERTAKWNRLLEIEAFDADATYAGRAALPV